MGERLVKRFRIRRGDEVREGEGEVAGHSYSVIGSACIRRAQHGGTD
jgi:hypothetical protein